MTDKDFTDLIKKTKDAVTVMIGKKALSVIRVNQSEGKWLISIEVLERAAIPDSQNLVGIYQFAFGKDHGLLGYERLEMKRQSDLSREEAATEKD